MLRQAFELRALVLVIDGIDEAAGRRERVCQLVLEELVLMRLRIVVTSRPVGVNLDDFSKKFVIMNLRPLSDEQQRRMVLEQLQGLDQGKEFFGMEALLQPV